MDKKPKPSPLPQTIKVANREPVEAVPIIVDRSGELQATIDRLEAENRDISDRLKIVEQQLKTKSTQLKKLQAKHDQLI